MGQVISTIVVVEKDFYPDREEESPTWNLYNHTSDSFLSSLDSGFSVSPMTGSDKENYAWRILLKRLKETDSPAKDIFNDMRGKKLSTKSELEDNKDDEDDIDDSLYTMLAEDESGNPPKLTSKLEENREFVIPEVQAEPEFAVPNPRQPTLSPDIPPPYTGFASIPIGQFEYREEIQRYRHVLCFECHRHFCFCPSRPLVSMNSPATKAKAKRRYSKIAQHRDDAMTPTKRKKGIVCTVTGCDKQFSSLVEVEKHILNSHAFTCSECSSVWTSLERLNTHIISAHSTKQIHCGECDSDFDDIDHFKTHQIGDSSCKTFSLLSGLVCTYDNDEEFQVEEPIVF